MAILNRVVNILVLVVSIAAVVLSYFLFSKREQLTDGWGKMATMINRTAKVLDDNQASGTNATSELSPEKLKHTEYKDLEKRLRVLEETAQKIIAQRDSLAATISKAAGTLSIAGVTAKGNQSIVSYEAQGRMFQAGVSSFKASRDDIANEYVNLARAAGVSVSASNIKSPKFRQEADKVKTAVVDLGKRKSTYENSFSRISSNLGISRPKLSDSTYANGLGSMESDVRKYRDNYKSTERDLNSAKNRNKSLEQQVARNKETIASLQNEVAAQKEEVARLSGILSADGTFAIPKKILTASDPECFEHISGKVDYIDPEFGFVTINIGENYVITQKCGIAKNLVPFPLKKGMVLTVVSGSRKFLGRIRITNVYKDTAVCNPIGETKGLAVGDTVYFTQDDIKDSLTSLKK